MMQSEIYAIAFEILLVAPLVVIIAFYAAWIVGEARRHGQNPLWGILNVVVAPNESLVELRPESYEDAEDAFSAAATLDELGEWDGAVELLKYAKKTWPKHSSYAIQCIDAIGQKRKLAE